MTATASVAPGPRGHVLLGKLLHIRRDRLGFVSEIAREFGDVVRFQMGSRILHLVSNADHVRYVLSDNSANYKKGVGLAEAKRWLGNGLVTSDGEAWARQRQLMQPAFARQRMEQFGTIITDATREMLNRWRAPAENGRAVDVAAQMTTLTLRIIARAMFSAEVADSDAVGRAFATALHDAMDRMTAIVMLPDWMPVPGRLRFRAALRTLNRIIDEIVRTHRTGTSSENTLLAMLPSLEVDPTSGLSEGELRDQVVTILLAGHETTASALAWTLYLLSRHPAALEKVRSELRRVVGARVPTPDDQHELVWTRQVLDESLRLYPPVWMIPRRAIAPDRVGCYEIPANSDVLVSPYVIHRDPRHWERPGEFAPERFDRTHQAKRSPYSYLPFGAGPRVCIGTGFAIMEAMLILVMVLQRYELRLVPKFHVVPEPLLTLRFRHGLAMTPSVV